MTESNQETVTAHGTIQYETVKCSSCGNQVPVAEAERFILGEPGESIVVINNDRAVTCTVEEIDTEDDDDAE